MNTISADCSNGSSVGVLHLDIYQHVKYTLSCFRGQTVKGVRGHPLICLICHCHVQFIISSHVGFWPDVTSRQVASNTVNIVLPMQQRCLPQTQTIYVCLLITESKQFNESMNNRSPPSDGIPISRVLG